MPKVGDKHYIYNKAGQAAAKKEAAKTGKSVIQSYDAGGRVNKIQGFTSDTMSPSYMGGYQEGGEVKEEDIGGLVKEKYWKHGRNVVDLKKKAASEPKKEEKKERKTGLDPRYRSTKERKKYKPKSKEQRKKETVNLGEVSKKVKTKVKKFAKDVKERVGRGVYKRKKRKLENLPKKEKRLKKSISKFKKNNPEDFDESGALKAYKDVEK